MESKLWLTWCNECPVLSPMQTALIKYSTTAHGMWTQNPSQHSSSGNRFSSVRLAARNEIQSVILRTEHYGLCFKLHLW